MNRDDRLRRIEWRMLRLWNQDRARYTEILALARQNARGRAAGHDMDQYPGEDYILDMAGLTDSYSIDEIIDWADWAENMSRYLEKVA